MVMHTFLLFNHHFGLHVLGFKITVESIILFSHYLVSNCRLKDS